MSILAFDVAAIKGGIGKDGRDRPDGNLDQVAAAHEPIHLQTLS